MQKGHTLRDNQWERIKDTLPGKESDPGKTAVDNETFAKMRKRGDILKKPLVVEFFGLPGSGKTTVHNAMSQKLIKKGIDVAIGIELKKWIKKHSKCSQSSHVLKHPIWTIRGLQPNLLPKPSSFITKYFVFKRILYMEKNLILLKYFLEYRKPDLLLLDEWSIHRMWSIFHSTKLIDMHYMSNMVHHIDNFLPKKYVFFDINLSNAAQRIANRSIGGSPFDGFDFETIKALLFSGDQLIQTILNAVRFKENDLLIVDAVKEPLILCDDIMQWLNLKVCTTF